MENNKLRQEIEKVAAWIESAKFHMDWGYNQATIIDKIEHADKAMTELKKFIGFNLPVSFQLFQEFNGKHVQMNDRFETVHIWNEELAMRNKGKWQPKEITKEKYDAEMKHSWNN